MTNVLDPAETRVINPETEQTAVLRRDVGEETMLMRPDLAATVISPLPRYETDLYVLPPRCGVVLPDVTAEIIPPLPGDPQPPTSPTPPPPVPAPGPPAWPHEPTGWYPTVAPLERVADPTEVVDLLGALGGAEEPRVRRSQPYRKPEGWVRVKRHRAPAPWWSWLLATAALSLTFGAVGGGIVLALAVLEVNH